MFYHFALLAEIAVEQLPILHVFLFLICYVSLQGVQFELTYDCAIVEEDVRETRREMSMQLLN